MILTGKAKEEFFNWLDNQGVNGIDISNWEFEKFQLLSSVSQNSLIIEWFDSVGIYIFIDSVKSYKKRSWRFHIAMNDLDRNIREEFYMDNRSEITYKAIKKANEIYNEKYSISQ